MISFVFNAGDQHMKYTQVYVDSGLCKQFPTTTAYVPAKDEIYCNPPIKGRKIKFVKPFIEGPGDEYTIPLCEVQVWGKYVCCKKSSDLHMKLLN